MGIKALDEYLQIVDVKFLPLRWFRTYFVVLPLSLVVLCGCSTKIVYQDNFDSRRVGDPPGPPVIGVSKVSGNVLIAENPNNDVSPDRWLKLRRVSSDEPLARYVAILEETVTAGGIVALVGYIPASEPITMSVYFETPGFPAHPGDPIPLLHIDLRADKNFTACVRGDICVNDSTAEGTFKFDTTVGIFVGFDLGAFLPTATLFVKGGGTKDAFKTVLIPRRLAELGLGRVRIETPLALEEFHPGRFLINELVATRSPGP